MSDQPTRVRAYHPPSGSVLTGEVVRQTASHIQLIPDGILNQIDLHRDVWIISVAPQTTGQR